MIGGAPDQEKMIQSVEFGMHDNVSCENRLEHIETDELCLGGLQCETYMTSRMPDIFILFGGCGLIRFLLAFESYGVHCLSCTCSNLGAVPAMPACASV